MITAKTDRDYLRQVELEGYVLRTWYDRTQYQNGYRWLISYQFEDKTGFILFTGDGFETAPSHPIDSDDSLRTLLIWITLKPGDTDDEYFDNYTKDQLEWCQSDDCEYINCMWTGEPDKGFSLNEFNNLDDFGQ